MLYTVEIGVTCRVYVVLDAESAEEAAEKAIPQYADDRLAYLQDAEDTLDVLSIVEES